MNGRYAEIDMFDDGETLATFAPKSQDYIITSHVFEHFPNPIKTLMRWVQVVKDGGYIFMIVPQRDAAPTDQGRPLSTLAEWYRAYKDSWTPDTIGEEYTKVAGGYRMHYFVYTAQTLQDMIHYACKDFGLRLELVAVEDPDLKVGNGFTLVYKVHPTEVIIDGNATPYTEEIVSAIEAAHDDGATVVEQAEEIGDVTDELVKKLIARHAELDPQLFVPQAVIHHEGADTDVIDTKPAPKKRRGGKAK